MGTLQILGQMCPPNPLFTEKECPDQAGKVFIVTGGYSGVGLELVKILYQKNATIYVAGRSEAKAKTAIQEISSQHQTSTGRLVFLFLDPNDLTTIKPAVGSFLQAETRLDVLWNNAGVMFPPKRSVTKQGHEMQLGSNSIAHFLLTKLLHPILEQTAASATPRSVRVCWAGSLYAELSHPKGVINFDDINYTNGGPETEIYSQSKAANLLQGSEWAKRHVDSKVLHLSFNPGNLRSGLQRHGGFLFNIFAAPLLYEPVYGAYTELYAGLSPDITDDHNGAYIIPWGRVATWKPSLLEATRSEEEGGTGVASRFYDWCEEQTNAF
ncbi:NAD(P)-binding protein, partial [Aspergillus sclerotiicarbonarius CBS 121057]